MLCMLHVQSFANKGLKEGHGERKTRTKPKACPEKQDKRIKNTSKAESASRKTRHKRIFYDMHIPLVKFSEINGVTMI